MLGWTFIFCASVCTTVRLLFGWAASAISCVDGVAEVHLTESSCDGHGDTILLGFARLQVVRFWGLRLAGITCFAWTLGDRMGCCLYGKESSRIQFKIFEFNIDSAHRRYSS
jgi:hypothetical protein